MLAVLGIPNVGDWDWVAIGTLALATATFVLAWQNRAVVRTSREQLGTAQQDLALAREQNATARAALDAQTAPYLTNLPPRLDSEPVMWRGGQPASMRDAATIDAKIMSATDRAEAYISVPFRNAGNGLATIKQVILLFAGGTPFVGQTDNPVLPPHERTRARFEAAPGASSSWDEVVSTLTSYGSFSLVIEYGDAANRTRGAVRLDIYPREGGTRPWYVRQVHYGATWEQAWKEPTSSSYPVA